MSSTPKRIVSVAPSVTETIFALGLGARVLAVTRYDDYPPAVKRLPKVGGFLDPALEPILELAPDLVIAVPNASNRPILERIAALGVAVLVVPGNSFSDLAYATRSIGETLGVPDRASRFLQMFEAKVEAVRARSSRRASRRAVFVYDVDPLVLAGPGSFAQTMMSVLNLENVVKIEDAYPKYSLEQLVMDQPAVIFDASTAHGSSDELWARLSKARVVRFEDHSVLRVGPRLVEGLQAMADALEP